MATDQTAPSAAASRWRGTLRSRSFEMKNGLDFEPSSSLPRGCTNLKVQSISYLLPRKANSLLFFVVVVSAASFFSLFSLIFINSIN